MLNGTLNGTNANGQSRILGADGQPLNSSQAWEKRTQEYGEFAVPHVVTFSSLLGRAWRTYRINRADEAMKHGREEALAMKRDAYLQGLLQERKLAVANRPWRIEVDNERDPRQKQVKEGITRVIKDTWRLNRLRYYLHEGIWYGRYGSQLVYEFADIPLPNPSGGGHPYKQRALRVKMHQPVNGDKIDFKWDGTPLMLVHGSEGTQLPGTRTVITDKGRAVLLEGNLRQRFIVHSHEAVDADFFDADSASAVWGIGIRSTLFWLNWLRQEWLANIADWCERTGLGLRLWYYQGGNDKSKTAVTEAARAQSDKTNILIPRFATGGGQALEGVDYVDTASAGADLLLRLQQHVEEHIERYVIGQTLSSSSEGSGLGGSGVSDFHADTKSNITKFDAGNETDTMTADLVPILTQHTYPWADFPVRYVVDVDDSNKKERMDAVRTAFVELGVDFVEDHVRALTGMDAPQEGEKTLRMAQAEMQAMQPKPTMGPDGEEGEVGEPGDGQEPDYEYGDDEGGKHAIDPETGDKLRGDQPDLYPDDADKGGDKGQYAKGHYGGERWEESKHHRGQPENAGQFGPGGGSSSETKPESKPAESKEGGKKPLWRKVQSRTGKPVWEHIPTRRRYYQERQPGQGRQLSPEAQQRKQERENAPPQVAPIGDRTKTAFKDMFGDDVTPEQAAKLIGAPKGLELNVFRNGDRDEISFVGQSHQVSNISRSLYRNGQGELVMHNNMFFLKPLHQGSGLGTDVFSDEVRACVEAGVAEIQTTAGKDRTMNGYYTWPRLGYDAPIAKWDRPRLPDSLAHCWTVQDLYETEEGRAWWKKHGDTTNMTFDLRPGSNSLKVLNSYLASKGKQTIPEPTQEQWQASRDKQSRGQGKAGFTGLAANFKIDEVAWEHFAEQIFNDKRKQYEANPAGFGTGSAAAFWYDAYRESAEKLIRNPALANEAPDKSRDMQRERVTGGMVPPGATKEELDAEARKHFDQNPYGVVDRDFRWGYAYTNAWQNLVYRPAQQARDADMGRYSWDDSKHPRDDAGRFKEKLSSMAHGDLRRVGGWLVRSLDDDKYRIDTDEGHVVGGAEKIERHIDRHKAKARLEGKAYTAAVKRGESAGDAPDILVDAERAKSEAERFHGLPHGTRVVSLADDTWGRLGTVERDKKAGRNRVKLDGEPGHVSEWVEPLEEGLSWRGEKTTTDKRISDAKQKEKETPRAKETVPFSDEELAALKADIRAAVPRATVKKIPTKAQTVDIHSGKAPFTVDEHNALRAVLRSYGAVTHYDGLHLRDAEGGSSMIGGLVKDVEGSKIAASPRKVNPEEEAGEKEPHMMTREEHEAAIEGAPTNKFVTAQKEDWGNLRGQGKRHGTMVMGGMRDSSLQGEKTYLSAFGKLPRGQAEEAESLEGKGKLAYAKARAVGFSHDHAMGVGYAADGIEFDPHRKAIESALAEGKTVPDHVLADYPDLAAKHKQAKPAPLTISDLRDDPKPARASLFADLEEEVQRDLFGGDEPKTRQATLFQRQGDVGRYGKDEGNGRWITIGAEEGEDGKRHGGSPVYIENGRITKGAPSLVGRHIDSLEVPEEAPPELKGTKRQQAGQKAAKTRTENEREAGYQRAVWGKKARKEGIDPKHLHQLAADLLAHHGELSKDRAAMLKEARSALDEFGSKHRTITMSRGKGGKGEIGDATEIPGIDQVAEWAAGKYPHLFASGSGADDQLFGMLSGDDGSGADGKEGWSEADAYEQAFEHLMEAKANPQPVESTGGDSWDDWEEPGVNGLTPAEEDAVPFARTAQPQFAPANEEVLRYAREVEALRAQVATLTAKPAKRRRREIERCKRTGRIVAITEIEG